MEPLDLGPSTAAMRDLVLSVRDADLARATPCASYSVGDLVEHVGGLAVAFAGAARKSPAPGSEQGGSGDAARLEPKWRERIADDLADLAEAWRDPAAYVGTTTAGSVEMEGAEAAAVALNEVVVHGWDLATALDRSFEPAPRDVEVCLGFARSFSTPEAAELRGDAFGEVLDVPEGAPPLTELLALLGRRHETGNI